MTSCCCLVEFGSSCFNHALIEFDLSDSVLDILQCTMIIVFIARSLYSIIFTICCFLSLLSPLYIYIYILVVGRYRR